MQIGGFAFLHTSPVQQTCLGRKWELCSSLLADIARDVNAGICTPWIQNWNTHIKQPWGIAHYKLFSLLRSVSWNPHPSLKRMQWNQDLKDLHFVSEFWPYLSVLHFKPFLCSTLKDRSCTRNLFLWSWQRTFHVSSRRDFCPQVAQGPEGLLRSNTNSSTSQNEQGKLARQLNKLMGVGPFVLIKQSSGYEIELGKFHCDFHSYWRKICFLSSLARHLHAHRCISVVVKAVIRMLS